jgi:hypothetical protein
MQQQDLDPTDRDRLPQKPMLFRLNVLQTAFFSNEVNERMRVGKSHLRELNGDGR